MIRFASLSILTMMPSIAWGQQGSTQPAPPAVSPRTSAADAKSKEAPFDGFAVYAGIGAGTTLGPDERVTSWRLLATVPLDDYFQFEGGATGYHFSAIDHHGERPQISGLGIAAGVRLTAPVGARLRPYAALRGQHLHFWPDPWGSHDGYGSAVDAHSSHHRWGAALAAGFELGLFEASSRWRFGMDAEGLMLTGPGANVLITAVATLGFGF